MFARFPLQLLALAALSVLLGAVVASAAETPTTGPKLESLDHKLLDGLDPSLFQQVNPVESAQPNGAAPTPGQGRAIDGEDLGQPSNRSPLDRVETGMRTAEGMLNAEQLSEDTQQVQRQVVNDLDAIAAALSKQCQAAQCQAAQQKPESRRSQKMNQKPSLAKGQGKKAAEDSTTRLNQGEAEAAVTGEMPGVLKDLWGHLPQRVREQMLQMPADEFLPKYQQEIEQYFRRLAEEDQQDAFRP